MRDGRAIVAIPGWSDARVVALVRRLMKRQFDEAPEFEYTVQQLNATINPEQKLGRQERKRFEAGG